MDAQERADYGTFSELYNTETNAVVQMLVCEVRDKQCKSEEEWKALVKPYMEN